MTGGLNFGMIRNWFHIKGILVHVFFSGRNWLTTVAAVGINLKKN